MDKLCEEEELEWGNNPYILQKEGTGNEARQRKNKLPLFVEVTILQSMRGRDSQYAHFTLVTGAGMGMS